MIGEPRGPGSAPTPRWATRCTACGTSFRVSPEQLDVSEGFVRCGRCDTVFNGRESLFDLDQPDTVAFDSGRGEAETEVEATAATAVSTAAPAADPFEQVEIVAAQRVEPMSAAEPAPSTSSRVEPHWEETRQLVDDPEFTQERLRQILGVNEEPAPTALAASSAAADPVVGAPMAWSALQSRVAPELKASPAWLAAAGVLCGLLALALPLQWAWIERDALRARYPQLDEMLSRQLPQVSARAWRHLEGLSVSSSALQATPQGGAYLLEIVLHNRSDHALAMPWLDLRLTDRKGQPLLRRALAPEALGAPTERLAAGEQRRLQAVFKVDGPSAPVAGYEVHLFHP